MSGSVVDLAAARRMRDLRASLAVIATLGRPVADPLATWTDAQAALHEHARAGVAALGRDPL